MTTQLKVVHADKHSILIANTEHWHQTEELHITMSASNVIDLFYSCDACGVMSRLVVFQRFIYGVEAKLFKKLLAEHIANDTLDVLWSWIVAGANNVDIPLECPLWLAWNLRGLLL